ncbi:hypothetical protein [Natrialba swarupiae]|uniref:Uncharacterized protein n=1 Tax=Natrialba swarupiae TaxID=2448032 RepID=A0A5D5ARE1_9EURY|nr:hypothetical protein [Natrialba swarupiae]TYT63593.1 hypothetical protein FYC77_03170 [Natrialba swarupiae]
MSLQTTQRTATESTLEETTPTRQGNTESFPYETPATGVALPTPTTRGVLRSEDENQPTGTTGTTDCPVCGESTVNGAGLFACTDCCWTGSLR